MDLLSFCICIITVVLNVLYVTNTFYLASMSFIFAYCNVFNALLFIVKNASVNHLCSVYTYIIAGGYCSIVFLSDNNLIRISYIYASCISKRWTKVPDLRFYIGGIALCLLSIYTYCGLYICRFYTSDAFMSKSTYIWYIIHYKILHWHICFSYRFALYYVIYITPLFKWVRPIVLLHFILSSIRQFFELVAMFSPKTVVIYVGF